MRKRLLTLLLAGVMAFSGSALVMADDEFDLDELLSQLEDVEVTEETYTWRVVEWNDYEQILNDNEALSNGSFIEEESLGIKFYMPDFMEEVELEEADKESGIVRLFWDNNEATVLIQVTEDMGVQDVKEFKAALEEAGDYEPMLVSVNGIDSVLYFIEPEDETPEMMSLAYIPEDTDTVVEFFCSPADMEGEYVDLFRVVMASLQTIE